MIAKRTPGPWTVSTTMRGVGNIKCHGVEDSEGRPIANCGQWLDGGPNARLIAAAPDLLDALVCAIADLEGIMPEYEPSGDRLHPAWKTIADSRAAIAKAKGE